MSNRSIKIWIWDRDLPGAQFRINRAVIEHVDARFARRLRSRAAGRFVMAAVEPVTSWGVWYYLPDDNDVNDAVINALHGAAKRKSGVEFKLFVAPETEMWVAWIIDGFKDLPAALKRWRGSAELQQSDRGTQAV